MLRHNRMAPDQMAAAPLPDNETRAAPIVTLISVIMLLVFSTRESLFLPMRQAVRTYLFVPVLETVQLVPTPPPRVHALMAA